MVLQPLSRNADAMSPVEQACAVGGDEVRHSPTQPDVTMQPESAVHCVDHAVAALRELHPVE